MSIAGHIREGTIVILLAEAPRRSTVVLEVTRDTEEASTSVTVKVVKHPTDPTRVGEAWHVDRKFIHPLEAVHQAARDSCEFLPEEPAATTDDQHLEVPE